MKILNQSQLERDKELAYITGKSLQFIQSLTVASPDSIRVYNKEDEPEDIEHLYKTYEHLNLIAYLRTLMKTSATRRHPELFKLLKQVKNRKCLDFGSGVGTHSIALAENKNEVHMLDVEGSELLHFAVKRFMIRMLPFYVHTHNEVLPEGYFDVVICSDVLEHVPNPLKELERIYKTMRKDGILHLLVSTMVKPSSGHFQSSIDEWKREGQKFMEDHFVMVKPTIWKKK